MVSVEVVIAGGGEVEEFSTMLSMRTKRALHPLSVRKLLSGEYAGRSADERKTERV